MSRDITASHAKALEVRAALANTLAPESRTKQAFKFSRRSVGILDGKRPAHQGKPAVTMRPVHPELKAVTLEAIKHTPTDMTVLTSTLRTLEEQRDLFNAIPQRTKTMNSMHLPQADGYVHAVDLGALEGGTLSWRPDVYFDIAEAMQMAARALGVSITWGGCWADISGHLDVDELHAAYVARKARQGGRPFFDGPHFQLGREFRT